MTVMLYKHPGAHKIHGDKFDYTIVDEGAVDDALSDGWSLTTSEALDGPEKRKVKPPKSSGKVTQETAKAAVKKVADDNSPPTRAEIEAKATELGIKFKANWKNETIINKIKVELNK